MTNITKFKLGDKVIGNHSARMYATTRQGWIGTVIGFAADKIHVRSIENNKTYFVDPEAFDLLTENKFKVGDLIVGNDCADKNYYITKKGWTGRVVAVDKGNNILVADEKRDYWVSSHCFDLIDSNSEMNEIDQEEFMRLIS